MAVLDKSKYNWVVDTEDDQFIGITIPFILDNGEEASTKTTLEAVKMNVLNLCSTEEGERVMQPNLGLELKRRLFEPFSSDLVVDVQNLIVESMNYWLPFVQVNDIDVRMSENESGDMRSTMFVSIDFSLKKDPSANESVQVQV